MATVRAPRLHRIVAVALAALWMSLPLGAAVHGAIESHEYCVEHQAVEHSSHIGAAIAGQGITRESAPDAHDACALGEACLRDALALRAPSGGVAPPPAALAVAPQPRARVAAVEILAAAPKTSPPATVA